MQATLSRPEAHPAARNRWRWSLPTVLLTLVLANAVLALVLFAVRSPSASPTSDVRAAELPVQIRALQQRIAAGQPGDAYALDLSDAELTAAAGYYAATLSEVPFTQIQLATTGDRVAVDAVTRGLAVPVPVHATVALTAVDGAPRARVEDVRVAGSGLPAFVRDQVLREANASLDLSRYDLPVTVDVIDLTPGRLVLRGHVR
jgi:hypothetical protein